MGHSRAADETSAFPEAFRISTFSFPHYEEGEYSGSRGAAEHAEKSNLPPSALSAPPREKKISTPFVSFQLFQCPLFFCSWGRRPRSRRRTSLRTTFEQANPRFTRSRGARGENPIFLPPRSPRLRVRKKSGWQTRTERGTGCAGFESMPFRVFLLKSQTVSICMYFRLCVILTSPRLV